MKPHIVLVSGASGSGKTTLIRQLRKRALPEKLHDLLPPGCESWPLIELNDVLKGNDPPGLFKETLATNVGVVLHYDIVMPFRYRLDGFEEDPAWTLLNPISGITIVFVQPDVATLRDQHSKRRSHQIRNKSFFSRYFAKLLRHPLKHQLSKLKGTPLLPTTQLYTSHDFINECNSRWIDFAKCLIRPHHRGKIITVSPLPAQSQPTFQIIAVLKQ